ncbi:excalibur calcium-binding domain-containing protein [Sphingobium sp. B2D3A]|nr:excalibur calcium-binding domain-containing protein [Sphingobium sp. B2D3A]
MSRQYPRRNFNKRHGKRRPSRPETTLETAIRYSIIAAASGVGIAFATHTWEAAQKRQAILDALPVGYSYSGCDQVRAAGVAPIRSYERGFSERLDGDGDGIGCEPYHGQ